MTQWKVGDSCSALIPAMSINFSIQSKLALSSQVSDFDSKSAKAKLRLGLFSYPVLQAADILLYGYDAYESNRC